MLETTILKVRHGYEREAKKLLPHVKSCDVFAIENAFVTEEQAQGVEKVWEDLLASGISLTRFREYNKPKKKHLTPELEAYLEKQMEYLFRSRRLIWNVERYSPNEVPPLRALKEAEDSWIANARQDLNRGDVGGFLSAYATSIEYNLSCNAHRDKHIGQQIQQAEKNIRNRYPALREKEPLRLTVCLGVLHAPERYCPAQPILLVGEPRNLGERLDHAIIAGKTGEELDPLLLAYGVWSIFKVPEAALEKMSYQEIVKGVQEGQFKSEYQTRKRQNLK